jgi:hypothetical protein
VGCHTSGCPALGWHDAAALLGAAVSTFVVILAQSAATWRAYAVKYEEPFSEDSDLAGLAADIGALLGTLHRVDPRRVPPTPDGGNTSRGVSCELSSPPSPTLLARSWARACSPGPGPTFAAAVCGARGRRDQVKGNLKQAGAKINDAFRR